jgi:D-alanyl-D-alanine carboxypeptidase/D-alanyl-D-alanine-endopeptidase (penicillin-binding protein 4)
MTSFLTEIGVEPKQYHFEDGSGLSRLTLVTPLTVSKLLLYMHASKHRDNWVDLLPIGGVDGTLAERYQNRPAGKNVRAKTGTLTHVTALSGYAMQGGEPRYAFTVMVNNFNAPGSEIRKVVDKISLSLLPRR